MARQNNSTFFSRYRRGLQTSIRNNSAAFGYSLVATSGLASLSHLIESPDLWQIYLFIMGAVVAFGLIEAAATKMFTIKTRGEPSEVVALGSAFGIVSISLAMWTAAGVAMLIQSWPAWPLAGFASSSMYLGAVAIEMALARRVEEEAGNEDEEEEDEVENEDDDEK